jgi:hypothetical protein
MKQLSNMIVRIKHKSQKPLSPRDFAPPEPIELKEKSNTGKNQITENFDGHLSVPSESMRMQSSRHDYRKLQKGDTNKKLHGPKENRRADGPNPHEFQGALAALHNN